MAEFLLHGKENYDYFQQTVKEFEADPILMNSHKFYEMTREEMQEDLMKKIKRTYEINKSRYFNNYKITYFPWFTMMFNGQVNNRRA